MQASERTNMTSVLLEKALGAASSIPSTVLQSLYGMLILLGVTLWVGNASAAPIASEDIVNVAGIEWVQPDLFVTVSWNEMNALCANGPCSNGELESLEMAGWTWASRDELYGLFNHFIGLNALGPDSTAYSEADSTWAPAFFDAFRATFSSTSSGNKATLGLTKEEINRSWARYVSISDRGSSLSPDSVVTRFRTLKSDRSPTIGGWFYRESHDVSAPSTILLTFCSLVLLCWARNGHKQSVRR